MGVSIFKSELIEYFWYVAAVLFDNLALTSVNFLYSETWLITMVDDIYLFIKLFAFNLADFFYSAS